MATDVDIEILDGGLGLVNGAGEDVFAVIGVAPLGTATSIVATRDPSALVAARGRSPAVEAACFALKQGAGTCLFTKAATATAGKVENSDAAAVNIASSTNANPSVVTTATPHGLASGDVATIAGHAVNTSINGTRRVTVLSTTTFSVAVAGIGVGTATGTTQRSGIGSKAGTAGTSTPTITGVPLDSARFRWKWIKGGTQGVSGATFAWSADGGATYSAELSFGTGSTYVIVPLGITVAWGAGTFVAGDEYRAVLIEPKWNDSGVVDCIKALGNTTQKFRLIELVGDMSGASAVTFDAELEALARKYRYTGLLGHARDFRASDTDEAGWITALQNDYASLSSRRISVSAGHYRVSSALDGAKSRRPLSFVAAARLMGRPIQEHPGRVKTGALVGIDKPTDADAVALDLDALVYHDERITAGLTSNRFLAAKTRIGRPGWFIDQGAMMSPPGSDFDSWPRRSVMDKACDVTYEVLVDEVNDDLDVDPNTGRITEKEARALESKMQSSYRTEMVAKRNCSAVPTTVSREDAILTTKTVTAHVRVVPRGFVQGLDIDIGYTNPNLTIGS